MTDLSHIPIHVRLTERWKIDPKYNPDTYNKLETLFERFKDGGAYTDWNVPDSVIEWVSDHAGSDGNLNHVISDAAAAMKMPHLALQAIIKNYRRLGARRHRVKYEELSDGEIKRDVWLMSTP